LYIPKNCIKEVLDVAYNKKHYFGILYMAKELKYLSIIRIIKALKDYIRYCLDCLKNAIFKAKVLSKLNLIGIVLILGYIIYIDFVVALLII
ncbi:hypothetical protein QBC44DRAFT_254395, partial [Cladorrhinum sp. PSN332]